MVEVTVNARDAYIQKIKKLLSNKDKLTSQDTGDGRNKYQVEINKIKKQLKGVEGISFKSLLKDVKKQEREGKFDRGAEGKTKKKLRAKMVGTPEKLFTKGRHKGSDVDKKFDKYIKPMDRDVMVSGIKKEMGTDKKKPKKSPNGGSR
jgi:hypothetical protein